MALHLLIPGCLLIGEEVMCEPGSKADVVRGEVPAREDAVVEGAVPSSQSFLQLLLLLSFGSGCAALIYEVVWFQLLQLVIGSSTVSLAVLLGTYMSGLCLGSLLLPRLVSPRRNPLLVCAVLELAIGVIGVLILFALPAATLIYSTHVRSANSSFALCGLLAAGCLLPPTMLMGATLPAVSRWIQSNREGVSWLGSFYGSNIAGAVIGCLLAGFYLLRVFDTRIATYVAAAINGIVALSAFALSFSSHCKSRNELRALAPERERPTTTSARGSVAPVYFAIALSGMTALAAEVIWTRLLSLTFGGTVYTFSIILAVFLIGLGVGSHFGSLIARRSHRPATALGWCQFLLTGAIAWTAYLLSQLLPYMIHPALTLSPWLSFELSLSHCLWALLPATLLWGASFPLALAAAAKRGQDPARLFGGVCAANTIGGIIGGVGCSVIILPLIGAQSSQRLLIAAAAAAALLLLGPIAARWKSFAPALVARKLALGSALLCLPFLFARSVPQVPPELLAFGRNMPSLFNFSKILYAGEGANYSAAVSQLWNTNIRMFHVSGKVEASTQIQDMRLQLMLGQLPALIHPKPQSVLVVGCGAGVTAGSFAVHPDVSRIVICELEPLVPGIAASYFSSANHAVLRDPRTQIVYDDARHYVLTTHEKFDIITSDPIHPWVKGSASLYTKEYFDLVKSHLNPGGIVTQWVPLYQSDLKVVKSELETFFEAFPNGTIWSSDPAGRGCDIVLLGQPDGGQINVDEIQHRLDQAGFARMTASLKSIGFKSAVELFAMYAGQARDLDLWLEDAQVNRDRDLRLQYLAGFTLNRLLSEPIYADLLAYRKFPDKLFVASPETRAALKKSMLSLSGERTDLN